MFLKNALLSLLFIVLVSCATSKEFSTSLSPMVLSSELTTPESLASYGKSSFLISNVGNESTSGYLAIYNMADESMTKLPNSQNGVTLKAPKGIAKSSANTFFVADENQIVKVVLHGNEATYSSREISFDGFDASGLADLNLFHNKILFLQSYKSSLILKISADLSDENISAVKDESGNPVEVANGNGIVHYPMGGKIYFILTQFPGSDGHLYRFELNKDMFTNKTTFGTASNYDGLTISHDNLIVTSWGTAGDGMDKNGAGVELFKLSSITENASPEMTFPLSGAADVIVDKRTMFVVSYTSNTLVKFASN